ncbi:MAG: succinate dehydrogenase cytochrome b subunit [Gemmatimonadota bacterium]
MPTNDGARASASRLRRFWDSSIGKHVVMAVTGIIGIGFVVGHMVGNLQMFKGVGAAQAMHDYAVLLRKTGGLLYLVRGVLAAAVALHVTAALQLWARNRAARPVAYEMRKPQVSTLASRTMRAGGVLLLAFIVFHIADMTFGVGVPGFRHLDPYNNLRNGFTRWWAVLFYIAAMVSLGYHLYHGAWASLRTLGARRPSTTPLHRSVALAIAVITAVGFLAVPIGAMLGLFQDDTPVNEELHTVDTRLPGRTALTPATARSAEEVR